MAILGDIVARMRMDNRDFIAKSRGTRNELTGIGSSSRSTANQVGLLDSSAAAMAATLGTVAVAAYGTSRALGAVVTASNELNQSLTRGAAIQELTGDQFARMREEALRLARDPAIKDFAPQLGEGYFFLASAGQTAEQQIASLETVATFATAGNFDLARATDLATDAQSALGMTSKDATENLANLTTVTDTLVRANTLANASVEQFSTAITNGAGAAAKSAGEDIADVTAVLAAFADQGIKDAEAGTKYSIVMRDLQTKAINNRDAFREAGIAVFDTAGNFQDFGGIIEDVEQRLAGLGTEAQKTALMDLGFTDKSVGAIQSLLGMSDEIVAFEAKLRDVDGTAERVAGKSLTDLDKAAKRSAANWEEFKIRTGEAFEPLTRAKEEFKGDVFRTLAASARNLRDNMDRWFGDGPGQTVTITGVLSEPATMPRRAADVEAEQAAERVRKLNELINARPRYTIDLTDAEKVGATADETAASLRELHNRLWLVRKALESGTISQEKYAAATANLYERLDQATGGARAYVRELARELDLLGMVEEQKKRAAMDEAGANMEDLDAVAAWQAELRFRRERLALERQLLDLRKPGTTTFREREAAGLNLDQIIELQRLEKAVADTTKAAAIKDALTTPRERITDELTEALRLFRRGKLDAETWQRQLAKSREEWAALNDEVREHKNLVSSAADAYSAEAWTRIFNAAQPSGGKLSAPPAAATAVPGAMTGPAAKPMGATAGLPGGAKPKPIGADSPDLLDDSSAGRRVNRLKQRFDRQAERYPDWLTGFIASDAASPSPAAGLADVMPRIEPRSVTPRATPPGNGDAATQDRVPQQQLAELQQLRRVVGDLLTANNRTTTAIEQLQTTIESDE